MSEDLFAFIRAQHALSQALIALVLPSVQRLYFPGSDSSEIVCGDMSSFARGTNNDLAPDLDIAYFNVPCDESQGYKNWTEIGTQQLTGDQAGITTLAELDRYDPRLSELAKELLPKLEYYFNLSERTASFGYVRSWVGYPGVVCNLLLPHPQYGSISVDLNLVYGSGHFGLEHAQRFQVYFERVVNDYGPERAALLIGDIRWVKQQAKDYARDQHGWIDRTQKLPGFVVEALFMQRYPPYNRHELAKRVLEYTWALPASPRPAKVGDQRNPVIDAGHTFHSLLYNMAVENAALTLGGWQNLLQIAHSISKSEA